MSFKFLWQLTEEDLPDITHDVSCSDNNGNTGDHCHKPLHSPHTQEDGKFCNKTGEERHTHRDETTNNKANGSERHYFVHTAKFRDLACMRTVIDHPNNSKEECG